MTALLEKSPSGMLQTASAAAIGADPDRAGRPTILIVEDSAVQAEMLHRTIEAAGYTVLRANDGIEGLAAAKACRPAAVVSDVNMPRMNGFELCRAMRADAALADVPLVLLTSLLDSNDVIQGLDAGADCYVTKPCDAKFLLSRIELLLARPLSPKPAIERRRMEVMLDGKIHPVSARSSQQILNLLISTYENAVLQNRDLVRAQDTLAALNDRLEEANRELKQAQAQLVQSAKMASLGQLVAGIAHEINNPLSFVMSHLATVERALDSVAGETRDHLSPAGEKKLRKARERLADMQMGHERIRDLVLKLRTFSRLDEGERKYVKIEESIESVITLLQYRLKDRIRVTRKYGEVKAVSCFPGPLNQVLMNVLANAVDAISGEGKITIRTGKDASMFFVAIADTGAGMSRDALEHLFEPFYTTKPVGQGTGLGLSICYAIIKRHNGTLEVRSEEGKGSEFLIRIPLENNSGNEHGTRGQ